MDRLYVVFVIAIVLAAGIWGIVSIYPAEPAPDHLFASHSHQVIDIHFSPDGQKLAVVSYEALPPNAIKSQCVRIFRVSDGGVLHRINDAAWKCAWNSDGSLLAVGSVNGRDFDLWDTATWTRKRRLTLPAQSAEPKKSSAPAPAAEPSVSLSGDEMPTVVQRLCFDRQGSLFSVVFGEDDDLKHAKVWWNPLAGSVEGESIGSCTTPWDVAGAGSGNNALVAISYDNPCGTEVLTIGRKSGKTDVRQKTDLKNLPHELTAPRIQLAADGSFLAVRDATHFDLVALSNEAPKLVYSNAAPGPPVKGSLIWWKELDVSLDGRIAAYASDQRLSVVRLSDGKSVFDIAHKPGPFALSPDGKLLAVSDHKQHAIVFYRLP